MRSWRKCAQSNSRGEAACERLKQKPGSRLGRRGHRRQGWARPAQRRPTHPNSLPADPAVGRWQPAHSCPVTDPKAAGDNFLSGHHEAWRRAGAIAIITQRFPTCQNFGQGVRGALFPNESHTRGRPIFGVMSRSSIGMSLSVCTTLARRYGLKTQAEDSSYRCGRRSRFLLIAQEGEYLCK